MADDMSAIPLIADLGRASGHVRKVPKLLLVRRSTRLGLCAERYGSD
jgi:hypothetical protein